MLLIRFTVLILVTVAAIAAVALRDTWASAVVATLLLLALLGQAVIEVLRYLSASENRSAHDEELLEAADLVEQDTGLPTRRRWDEYTAVVDADDVAANGPVPAEWQGPDAARRVLLVTSGPIDAARIKEELLAGTDTDDLGVLVIAPTLASNPLRLHVGDASEAVPHAQAVLNETLEALRSENIRATGHIGAADPATAVSDGLRTYDAQLVIVARHHNGRLRHLEDEPVERAATAFGVPLRDVDLSTAARDGEPALALSTPR